MKDACNGDFTMCLDFLSMNFLRNGRPESEVFPKLLVTSSSGSHMDTLFACVEYYPNIHQHSKMQLSLQCL